MVLSMSKELVEVVLKELGDKLYQLLLSVVNRAKFGAPKSGEEA
jgi:hypothetical protein